MIFPASLCFLENALISSLLVSTGIVRGCCCTAAGAAMVRVVTMCHCCGLRINLYAFSGHLIAQRVAVRFRMCRVLYLWLS